METFPYISRKTYSLYIGEDSSILGTWNVRSSPEATRIQAFTAFGETDRDAGWCFDGGSRELGETKEFH